MAEHTVNAVHRGAGVESEDSEGKGHGEDAISGTGRVGSHDGRVLLSSAGEMSMKEEKQQERNGNYVAHEMRIGNSKTETGF